ncbi:hypothetical protein GCM10020367_32910 [Streptomyces sannanensis]|uniref:histidine kinase n=1 Tax=Streptomyces sannanensis TaxID=285536 RepID=A0ABP6SCK7_9ACTN
MKLRARWKWPARPELWSRRRLAGELVLAVVMALLAAGIEDVTGARGPRIAAVAVAVAVLGLLRCRLPASVLVVTGFLGGVWAGTALLLILAGWSGGRRIIGAGRALAAFTVSYAGYMAMTAVMQRETLRPLTLALFTSLYFLATTVVPGLASRYWTQRRTLLHALQERNAQLLRERTMVEGQARLRERQRIAQDMHDSLGHQLALISVHTGALEVDPGLTERQREAVGVLRDASVAAMHELRAAVGILRDGVEAPTAADEAQPAARGVAGVEGLVEASRSAGTEVALRCSGAPRPVAAAADHAAYRIVQEALTNAYKHAPGVPITVELRYEPDSLVVEIANGPADRPAGEVVSGGQGLTGLRERARLVGGMVHAGPVDGGGFRVAGVLPYGPGALGGEAQRIAPFVDAADDFRQQSPVVPLRHGGPVTDWTLTERELGMSGKNGMSTGAGIAIGCGIAFGVLVLLMVALGFGIYSVAGDVMDELVERSEYDAIHVGDSEKSVRERLPSGESWVTAGLDKKGPARPAGSECLVTMSAENGSTWSAEPVFRFCFKGGKLIEKKAYEIER